MTPTRNEGVERAEKEEEEVGGNENITRSFFLTVRFWEVWQLLIQNICSR